MTWCFAGVVRGVVHPVAEGHVGPLGGRRDDDLLGAAGQMRGGLVAVGEQAGALEHHVDAEVLPGQLSGVAFAEYAHALAVYEQCLVTGRDFVPEGPVHGIVLEEVGERLGIGQVVDGDKLQRAAVLERRA